MAVDLIVKCSDGARDRIVDIMRVSASILSIAETGFVQEGSEIRMNRGQESVTFQRSGTVTYSKAPTVRNRSAGETYEFEYLPSHQHDDPRDVATGLANDLMKRIDSAFAHRDEDEVSGRLAGMWALLSVASKAAGLKDQTGYVLLPHRGDGLRLVSQNDRRAMEINPDAVAIIGAGLPEVEICQVVASDGRVSVLFHEVVDERDLFIDMPAAMREMQRLNISDAQLELVRTTPVET